MNKNIFQLREIEKEEDEKDHRMNSNITIDTIYLGPKEKLNRNGEYRNIIA